MDNRRREYPTQPLLGVGVVVIRQDEVLLIERRTPPYAGYWSVPGGLVELGEETRAAAAREVREETGLEVEIGGLLTFVDRIERTAEGHVQYHYVLAEFRARPRDLSAPLRPASDAGQARWVGFDQLAGYRLTPGLQPVLEAAFGRAGG